MASILVVFGDRARLEDAISHLAAVGIQSRTVTAQVQALELNADSDTERLRTILAGSVFKPFVILQG